MLLFSSSNKNKLDYLLLFTLLALIPQYLIRCNLSINWWMYKTFSTYAGDLWYVWNNYFIHDFPYPREYPALIQLIFDLIYFIPGVKQSYTEYIIFPVILLTISALISTYLLYKLQLDSKRILWLWILAPSFLFYGIYNLDLVAITAMSFSYYYFAHNKYPSAAIWLAIGTAIKVFPVFLLPVYFFSCKNNKQRIEWLIIFIVAWLCINIPFMVVDWHAWIYPYVWQIRTNLSYNIYSESWTWIIFKLFNYFGYGGFTGISTLIIFATLYLYLLSRHWQIPLAHKCMLVMLLFLLTDRVYSPQYTLYLLPFLVLVDYKVNWKYFYLMDIINVAQVMFYFKFQYSLIALNETLLFIKYAAIILLLLQLLRQDNLVSKQAG